MFVVFEGIDLGGKTTLIKELQQFFALDEKINQSFKNIVYTKEPGTPSVPFCLKARELVLDKQYSIDNITRMLLFLSNRCEHIKKLIEPSLKEPNSLVICDRFSLSTIIYQGEENEEMISAILQIQKLISNIKPDITFILNIPEDLFLERYKKKFLNNKNDVLDDYAHKNFWKIRKQYDETLSKYKKEFGEVIYIDGTLDMEKKLEIVKKAILDKQTSNTCLNN